MRVQLLARDVIVSTRMPQYLSVRNSLQGVVTAIDDDGTGKAGDLGSDLVSIDIGAGVSILARVTRAATRELELAVGACRLGARQSRVVARPFLSRAEPACRTEQSPRGRYLTRVPRCMIPTMWSVALSPTTALTSGVVGRGAGLPHHAVAQIVRGQEQVLRGGAGRDHLLYLRHLGILAHRAAHDDEGRGTQHFLALGGELLIAHRRRAAALGLRGSGSESLPDGTLEHHQMPWFHAPVIGRARGGCEDPRKVIGAEGPGAVKRAAEARVSIAVSRSISSFGSVIKAGSRRAIGYHSWHRRR